MTGIILRRKRLGKGSTEGITNVSNTDIAVVRSWVSTDWYGREGPAYIFRWGCTSSIPELETEPSIVNTARSIHWCSDKRQSRLDMQAAGVPVPPTCIPEDVEEQMLVDEGENNQHVLERVDDGRRCVARPSRHAQGKHLFVGDILECADWCSEQDGGYISDLIDKVAEYRVMVVQNRVAWVAHKTPGNPDDVAWNVAQGGRFDNVRWGDWPNRVIMAARHAAKVSGTDFCGVDVMVDADGNPYVLEVNSAPSQTSPYRQQCLAKCFDWIVTNGKQHFPDSSTLTWKNTIHPAVWSGE